MNISTRVITKACFCIILFVLLNIEERYEINFLEIGLDGNHVHFLIQSVPLNSPKKMIGSVTERKGYIVQMI
ncbi:MAG: transposase [Oleispira sp.]|nr:transposase [Oleispira sp.]